MIVKAVGNYVAVVRQKQLEAQKTSSPFIMPEVADNLGTVVGMGGNVGATHPELEVGRRVYFGSNVQSVRMNGEDVLMMEPGNVFAVAPDSP